MRILAIPGSIRKGSFNAALLDAMSRLPHETTEITLYHRLKDIPIFNPDMSENTLPEPVTELMERVRESDGVIISTPEYAHGIPGVIKNMLDWLVASDVLVLKPVVVTSVSTSSLGGARSHAPLVQVLSAMNANVVVEGSLNVPYASNKFHADGGLTDAFTRKAIHVSLLALEQAIARSG